jgi:hypothetical protein
VNSTGKLSLGSTTRGVVVAHEVRGGEGARTDFPVLIMGVPIAGLSRVAGWPANVAQLAWLILFA